MKPSTYSLLKSLGRPAAAFAGLAVFAAPAASQSIAITEFFNNPTTTFPGGSGNGDSGIEFLELFNYGTTTVDLTGWTISDEDTDSFTIPSLSLNSGEYAVFVGPGNFTTEVDVLNAFNTEFFGGTAPVGANIIPMLEETSTPGTFASAMFFSNSSDELIIRSGQSTQDVAAGGGALGDVVWSVAYANDESFATPTPSTFLATDDFSVPVSGSKAAPGINRNGVDNGNSTTLGYLENATVITDGVLGDVTIFDTALSFDGGGNPIGSASNQIATPLAGFYTTDGSGVGPLDDYVPPVTATVGFGQGGGANEGTLNTEAAATSTQNVKLVITAIADPDAQFNARVIELTALEAISEAELAQYGLNAANNGSDESNRVETPIAKAGGLAAGESIYVVEEAGAFRDFFASVDGGGNTTPFPADGIVAEDTPVTLINGDDAIQLTLNGVEVDRFGVVGVDGSGEDWEYEDGYAQRLDGTGPSTTFSAANFDIKLEEYKGPTDDIEIGILPPQIGPFDGISGGTPQVQSNFELDSPRLALMDDAGNAVDANGDPITDPANVVIVDRTALALGSYDSLGTTGPAVETPVAGEYIFAEAVLTTGVSTGFVTVSGVVPQDTVLVGLDIETPAGSPDLAQLLAILDDNEVVFTDISGAPSGVLPGYSDNPLYDDYEIVVEVGTEEDGTFDINWNFVFDADAAFSANPLVTAIAFGTVEASAALVGDFNGDGFVSQPDLDLVLLNWGDSSLPAGFDENALSSGGPFDSLISQNELDDVLLNWGNGTPPAPVNAIPEPTSLALLGLGGLALSARRRRLA